MRRVAAVSKVVFTVFLAAGCCKPKKPESSKTIEDFTGITAIKQGEAIKRKLNEAEKSNTERFKELEKIE